MLRFKARRKSPALQPQGKVTESERRIIRIVDKAMQEVRRDVTRMRDRLTDAVAHRPVDFVVNMMPVDPWYDAQKAIERELLAELLDAGSRVKLQPIQKAKLSFSFDRTREEAANWARNEAGSLIRDITNSQREMVRDLVARAQLTELSPRDVAREIRNGIGLTSQQSDWVNNFYERAFNEKINAGYSYREAWDRASAAADRYQDQVVRYRAKTIARTEIMRANSEGRREAWAQGVEGGWIGPNAKKEWIAEDDACDICEPMSGVSVPLNEPFPIDEPPAHPNCRCDLLLVDEIPDDISAMTDEELDAALAELLNE